MAQINSINQFIQLLKEKDTNLNVIGLRRILSLVDTHWHEISQNLDTIEEFYENEKFQERKLAAYIASKIYFNLEEYEEALDLAIKSGENFDLKDNSQFTTQLINTCIHKYITEKQNQYEGQQIEQDQMFTEYEKIVDYMFEQSIESKEYKHVIGIAVEARRMDVLNKVLTTDQQQNPNNNELLQYLFDIAVNIIKSRKFRIEILKKITEFYKSKQSLTAQDLINQSLCYFNIDDYESVANLLNSLVVKGDEESVLSAYQVANEISENENQYFIDRVIQAFPIQQDNEELTKQRDNLIQILTGETRKKMNKIFLTKKNFSDPQVITEIKEITSSKQSIALGGVTMANGIFNFGTNDQRFIDNNKKWLENVKFWNKFSSIASLGVIHKGSLQKPKQLFADFIPGAQGANNQGSNPNANGGALYGMGLFHEGSKNKETIDYFIEILQNPEHQQNETIVHGAALGLGLVGLASEDQVIYGHLQNILNTSQSISGEAAGLGIGLVMAGSGNDLVIQELISFAKETDRDKIIRSCSVALGMIVFGKEQAADTLIETLSIEKNSILRYGACMTIGMAYVGSGNQWAIRKLLNFAVTDVADDVRRMAVIALAFVMCRIPDEYLKMVKLLSISYSPHVRYGTAFGIGIACAGTCNSEAYELLEPLLTDSTSFVRQAAYMGTAMLFQLSNKTSEPKLEKFTKTLQESYAKKSEDVIVKYGAMLSMAILRSGGQNSVIKLTSFSGFPKLGACVSMLAFSHFWHWYPLVHFYNLTLSPSAIIGVNQEFQIPTSFEFLSNTKPANTDYIPHIKKDSNENKTKKDAVSLSTTNRAKARAQLKETMKDGENSKVDTSSLRKHTSKLRSTSRREELIKEKEKKEQQQMEIEEQEKKEEITSQVQKNPSRVLDRFKKYITFIEGNRYTPILKERKTGILFLRDSKKGEEEEYLVDEEEDDKSKTQDQKQGGDNQIVPEEDEGPDVQPPEDFIFDPVEQNK